MSADLLIEIGVEELPPAAMRTLADSFADQIQAGLAGAGFEYGPTTRFATPRRLAVAVDDVATQAMAVDIEKYGPKIDIAFAKDGTATAAARGFAASVNASLDVLSRENTAKGERLVYRDSEPGDTLENAIERLIVTGLTQLPIPKRMRWGNLDTPFVRPVHWVVVMHGQDVLPCRIFDIGAGRATRGHRFHHPGTIELDTAAEYAPRLADRGWVIADPDVRATSIREQVDQIAKDVNGQAIAPDWLIEEVNALVEYPVALAGTFNPQYLALPREVLIAAMQKHQRYFAIQDTAGELQAKFVAVANIASREPAQVVAGNERVIRPRLDDALFFWNQDRERGLDALVPELARVTFERSLGSLSDKSKRIGAVAQHLCAAFGVSQRQAERATTLAKTDLLTAMVDEFPDLQGIMGGYYARGAGEDEAVAAAIAEHYAPSAAGAPIAATAPGQLLAVADRLDTLAGIFAIGKAPSGDRDPYALRRAALGVIRTLIESGTAVDLKTALEYAVDAQPVTTPATIVTDLHMFHVERMRSYYVDQGVDPTVFEAVAAVDWRDPVDFDYRLRAARGFVLEPAARIVCAAHKRVRNLLRRESDRPGDWSHQYLSEPAEIRLAEMLDQALDEAPSGSPNSRYPRALQALTAFADPLAAFFDQVRVLAPDTSLRCNRLALLAALDRHFCEVADISLLARDASAGQDR